MTRGPWFDALQHPATHDAWRWLHENRERLGKERADRIDIQLRETSSLLWELDREAKNSQEPTDA